MNASFQIQSLKKETFQHLFELDDAALSKRNIVRMTVTQKPSFPCRVSLVDAEMGEEVLLLNYQHLDKHTPYQSNGAIFVRKIADTADLKPNEIPFMLTHRLLSVRGYDQNGMMKNAVVTEGEHLESVIQDFFSTTDIKFLHIHNAKPGCFNCVVTRV